MRKRKRRSNPFTVAVLLVLVGAMIYVNQVVVPEIDNPFVPSPTATRNPEAYITEAEAFVAEGRYLQAIESYNLAIAALPADPALYLALAQIQMYAGKYPEAQISAENAILLNNNNSMAHALKGWSLYFQGDPLQAEAAINKALELDPNNAYAYAFLAELIADQYANGQGALDSIEKMSNASNTALQLAPNSMEAHRARGYVLEVTGNPQEAAQEYSAALVFNENVADVHASLGRVYRVLEVYDKAVDEFGRAYALNPADTTPNVYISRIYAGIGEFPKAVQYAEQAVNDEPLNARWRGNLGVMYYRNTEYDKALEQLAFAVKGGVLEDGQVVTNLQLVNDGRIAEYFFTYGLALIRNGQCAEAIPLFRDILDKIPENELAVYNAQEGLRQCAENIGVTPTPEPGAATEEPVATPTP